MSVFEHFPYTNFHDLNLDWIVQELEKLASDVRDFISINAIKYANPILWDITSQYEKNTVVLDKDGNAYLSVQPVPAGVSLDRTEYWTNIGNFSALWESVKEAITIPDEGHETTASAPRAVHDLVWVNGQLLEVTSPMIAGDSYVIGSNCRVYSMQIFLTETLAALQQEQEAREQADANLLEKIQQETSDREEADSNLQTQLNAVHDRKILYIGDSYMQGIGGTANAIPERIGQLFGAEYVNIAEGGAGWLRKNDQGHNFVDIATNYVNANNIRFTDIVIMGGYNDMGLASTDEWNSEAFETAVEQLATVLKSKFPVANMTAICFPWIDIAYNSDFYKLSVWLESACNKAGFNTSRSAINWLLNLPGVASDSVHPNSAGYEIIADYTLATMRGSQMCRHQVEKVDAELGTGSFTISIVDPNAILITGQTTLDETGTGDTLFTLPDWCSSYGNYNLTVYKYGNFENVNTANIIGRRVQVAGDKFTQGTWIVNAFLPFANQ